jgi:hypothetical protein
MATKKKKNYDDRDDFEKIQSQWTKLTGLHNRAEWSAAVIRAATAVELAANVVIRSEFKARGNFEPEFVNSLLKWANGLAGKIDKLILPLCRHDQQKHREMKDFCKLARDINDERNDIAHRGIFCSEKKAKAIIQQCKTCVEGLLRPYQQDFSLKEPKDTE